MAEIKDKIVSVEDLSTLHEYNKTTYMPIGTIAEDIGVSTKKEALANIPRAENTTF